MADIMWKLKIEPNLVEKSTSYDYHFFEFW